MSRYTEAQKKSAEKYLKQFINVTFRVTPEEKHEIEKRAAAAGKSVNQFLKDKALTD
jgi:predicted HicB family RNase H-like nuclease